MFSLLQEFGAAQRIAAQKFNVIFFAESRSYFQYFEHLFESLVNIPKIKIAYISSDKADPVLADHRIQGFYLKATLAGIFPRLQADVLIMTMPDMQNFIFKKSPGVKKYIYVFHALVSTHQQYRAHAFDHYDAILCTGPQQEAEIRESETLYSLPEKQCVHYGYPLLQALKEKAVQISVQPQKILIAPSWYAEGILATCILPLVEALQREPCEIWIRPHPEFMKRYKKTYEKLLAQTKNLSSVRFDTSPSVYTHLTNAAHLITDRSGIALEYAFATYRPVLFVDTLLKVQNTEVHRFSIEPLENAFRKNLGEAILPTEVEKANAVLQKLRSSAANYRTSIEEVEDNFVFSPSHWQNGINYIQENLRL